MTTLIEKSILNERLEKSRSGTYADTSENRRKHRVGQKYGSEKKEEEKPEKTSSNEKDPAKELEAVDKVIAAINEGKLKLPQEEIMVLIEKKNNLELAKRQAEKINAGVKANEEKRNAKEIKETNQKPNIYITPENSEGYVRNLNKLLDKKGYFAHATRTGGIEIYKKGDRKSLGNLKASIIATDYISWGPNEDLKDMLEPLIKEALSSAPSILDKLIDISVDFNKEDLKSLDDKSLNELKDKLREKYNEEDKLERRAFERHGYFTANPESAKYDDRLRAVENEIKKRAESKNEPEKNEKSETEKEADEETYTRAEFDDLPNSGRVNLKKYLSEKVRKGVDEKWSNIKNIPTENLKKMEKGLVNDFNKNFEAIKKSQRAELLYSIMKVKGELEKRGKESQKKE